MSIFMVHYFFYTHTLIYIHEYGQTHILVSWIISPNSCPISTEIASPQHTNIRFRIPIFIHNFSISGPSDWYHNGEWDWWAVWVWWGGRGRRRGTRFTFTRPHRSLGRIRSSILPFLRGGKSPGFRCHPSPIYDRCHLPPINNST